MIPWKTISGLLKRLLFGLLPRVAAFFIAILLHRIGVIEKDVTLLITFVLLNFTIATIIEYRDILTFWRIGKSVAAGEAADGKDHSGEVFAVMDGLQGMCDPIRVAHKDIGNLQQICDKIHTGIYTQSLIDMVEEVEECISEAGDTGADMIGSLCYRVDLLQEIINPKLEHDVKLLQELNESLTAWWARSDPSVKRIIPHS
jgi:hypothetical protein